MAIPLGPGFPSAPAPVSDAMLSQAAWLERASALVGVDLWNLPFAVVDIETTGSVVARDSITEIAIVGVKSGRITRRWRTFVNPAQPIPRFISSLTGITDDMVAGAPHIRELLPTIVELIGDDILVGHNVRFDAHFIDTELRRHGLAPLSNITIDTLALARRTIAEVPNYKLGTLTRELGIDVERHHRALADADATAALLIHCVKRLEDCAVFTFGTLLDFLKARAVSRRKPLLRRNLPCAGQLPVWTSVLLAELREVPARPGVYTLRDAANDVVYVGKSRNLRQRLRAYATAGKAVGPKLRALRAVVASLSFTVTGSELEALLLEAELVQTHNPPFNERLRNFREFAFIKVEPGPKGRLLTTTSLRADGARYYGPYRSLGAAAASVAALQEALGLQTDAQMFSEGPLPAAQREALLDDAVAFIDGSADEVLLTVARRRDEAAARSKDELAAREEQRLERLRRLRARHAELAFATGLHAMVLAGSPEPSEEACFLFCAGRLVAQARLPRRLPERGRAHELMCRMLTESFRPELAPRCYARQQEIDQLHIFASWYRDRREALYYAPLPERTPGPAEAVDWANAVLDGRPVGPQLASAADLPKDESRGA